MFAVVYARHSPRPSPEECDSVEKQIERCRAYCAKQGYTVVREFSDKNMSGGRADNRPGLQAAIRETIKHNHYHHNFAHLHHDVCLLVAGMVAGCGIHAGMNGDGMITLADIIIGIGGMDDGISVDIHLDDGGCN